MIDTLIQALHPMHAAISASIAAFAARLLGALLMMLFTVSVAGAARWVARRAARTEWLERLLLRSGILSGLVEPSLAGSRSAVASTLYWSILIAGSTATLAIVSEQAAKYLVNLILILLPNLALAFAIIMAAWWLGSYWSRATLIQMTNEGVTAPWRWAAAVKLSIVAAGIALACESTGFATTLVRGSFLILLAGGTYAAAQAVIPIFRAHLEEQLLPGRGKMHNPIDDRVLR